MMKALKLIVGIFLVIFEISVVQAAPAAGGAQGNSWTMLLLPVLLIAVFYFLMIRPQAKQNKMHRAMLERISVGDEIATRGGVLGKVTQLKDDFMKIEIAQGTEVILQKGSVSLALPKGTMNSV